MDESVHWTLKGLELGDTAFHPNKAGQKKSEEAIWNMDTLFYDQGFFLFFMQFKLINYLGYLIVL